MEKAVSAIMLTLLLISMLTLVLNIQLVKAQQKTTIETKLFSHQINVPAREIRAPSILLIEGTHVRIEFNASEPLDLFCQDSWEYSQSAASGWVILYYHWSNKTANIDRTYTIPTTDTWYFTLANYEYHDVDVYNITLYQLTTYEIRLISDKKYYNKGEQVTLTVNVTRDDEAASGLNVTLQVLGPSGDIVFNQSAQTAVYGQVVGTFTLPSEEGTYTATAQTIIDGKPIEDTTIFAIDETPPVINIISPENGTYVLGSVSLTFNINEPTSWIGYSLNDQANVTITGNTTLTNLVRGVYSIVVYANDIAGNTGNSNKIFFEVVPHIEIDHCYVSDDGADIGSIQTVGFHAKWDNSSDAVEGSIYVNETEYITNGTGWISFNVSSSTFGKEEWVVTGVNCSGVTTYIQTVLNPSIFWGRALVLDWIQFFYWDGFDPPSGAKLFLEPEHEWWQIRWHYVPSNNESYHLGFEVYIYEETFDEYPFYVEFSTEGRTEGQYRFDEPGRFMIICNLGNIAYLEILGERVDDAPPITSDDYDGTWRTSDFTITLTAADKMWGYLNRGSGVLDTYYQINDGSYRNVSAHGQPLITSEGANTTLEYWSVDRAGNEEIPHKILAGIKVDKTAPIIGIPSQIPESNMQPDQRVRVLVNVTDFGSGLKDILLSYKLNDDAVWTDLPMTFNTTVSLYEAIIPEQQANALVKYKIVAYDNAGNHEVEDNGGQYYVYTVIPEFPPSDITPPFPTWIVAAIVIIAVVGASLLVYFLKIKKTAEKTK